MIYLGSDLSNAHQKLRYTALRQGGFLEMATGFCRDLDFKFTNDIRPLALTSNGQGYFRRIWGYLRIVRFLLKNKSNLYLYGPDVILIASIITRIFGVRYSYILEIADIHPIYTRRTLLNYFLIKFINSAEQVVVTSVNFATYFHSMQTIANRNFVTIENKCHIIDAQMSKNDRIYDIGYFGLIRDIKSLGYLKELADAGLKILIAGKYIGISQELVKLIEDSVNMDFYGIYEYAELPCLYGRVKYSWSVYPLGGNTVNRKLAWTNRFYESLAFEVPIIIDVESGDASHFHKMMGIKIDFGKWSEEKDKILNLNDVFREKMVTFISENKAKFRINSEHYKVIYRCISSLE